MSDYHVGLITEGRTDVYLLERIISLMFPDDKNIIVTTISPTEDELMGEVPKPEGFGWGGVYNTCRNLESKLALQREAGISYDLFIIHVDGDVGYKNYQSANIIPFPDAGSLPSNDPDKPLTENCELLKQVVLTWVNSESEHFVCCIPYINMDIWAAFSLYPRDRAYLFEGWTEEQLNQFLLMKGKREGRLVRLKDGKIRKITKNYQTAALNLSFEVWHDLTMAMNQAARFEADIRNIQE